MTKLGHDKHYPNKWLQGEKMEVLTTELGNVRISYKKIRKKRQKVGGKEEEWIYVRMLEWWI